MRRPSALSPRIPGWVPRIVGFPSTTLRNDFDADLAFVGQSVELTSAPIRSGSSASGENVREGPGADPALQQTAPHSITSSASASNVGGTRGQARGIFHHRIAVLVENSYTKSRRLIRSTIDRNARLGEQAHLPAQLNKLHANPLDRRPTVLAKVGNRLVIGNQPAGQPHYFDRRAEGTITAPGSGGRARLSFKLFISIPELAPS
jgi:hypothetical protein